ncbi:hypothetical protein BDA96_07G138300 [Sorghum bicolor]|uniref:Uncharacterized protein n=1 Tax=Sorghum bicolor TaxID=4558 RepID=A0A921QJX4_SORBI|nr:hypothetical protein BDA96_07G138300 [Sorghum bicolor]KAG0523619.1 hypothetical protein BDA96_07G138300 [Sorghum bicolor]
MATLPVKPLDGADGYLRWKESMLLRLHSVGVAHVLSDDPPAPAEAAGAAAAKKWARDDAVCRGHILYALSDRIFPDYVRHGTGRAVWQAVARTYDVDKPRRSYSRQYERFLHRFRFEEGASSSFLEQLAHAEALVATRDPPPSDDTMASWIWDKLPADMAAVISCGEMTMDLIWKCALNMEERRIMTEERLGHAEAACVRPQELDSKTTGHRHRRR